MHPGGCRSPERSLTVSLMIRLVRHGRYSQPIPPIRLMSFIESSRWVMETVLPNGQREAYWSFTGFASNTPPKERISIAKHSALETHYVIRLLGAFQARQKVSNRIADIAPTWFAASFTTSALPRGGQSLTARTQSDKQPLPFHRHIYPEGAALRIPRRAVHQMPAATGLPCGA